MLHFYNINDYIWIDQYLDGDRDSPGYRPDPLGQDTNFGRPSLGRPGKLMTNLILLLWFNLYNPSLSHLIKKHDLKTKNYQTFE